MAVHVLRSNFTAGELSPLTESRGDLLAVRNGCRELTNFAVLPYGGVAKRPGTDFIAACKSATADVRLTPFVYSTVQTYVIEVGHRYMRFFADGGSVVSGGVPYEIATTYDGADIGGLQWVQSADVLFKVHGKYPPRRLKRLGHTNWVLENIPFVWPAFQPEFAIDEAANIKASAVTGSITLTANKSTFDAAKHVGAAIQLRELPRGNHEAWEPERRRKNGAGDLRLYTSGQLITYEGRVYEVTGLGSDPQAGAAGVIPPVHESGSQSDGNLTLRFVNYGKGWATITSVTSATSAHATVMVELPQVVVDDGTKMWSLGAWGPGGYPTAIAIHQGRMCLAGSALSPDHVFGSAVEGWLTYRIGSLDDDAFDAGVVADDVQAVRFMRSAGNRLIIGTEAGVWSLSPGPNKAYLAPSAIVASFDIGLGSATGAPAKRANHESIFLHRSRRRIYSVKWALDIEGMQASDLTVMAEHIARSGVKEWTYQEGAVPTIWAVLNNGDVIACTYMPEQEIVGWSRYRTDGRILSLAVIPDPDGDDEVWIAVDRGNGRFIERFRKPVRENATVSDLPHLDSAISYSGVPVSTVSGLGHLAGKTVSIVADGMVLPSQVVPPDGSLTLPRQYSEITVGLPYRAIIEPADPDVGAPDGTTLDRHKRTIALSVDLQMASDFMIGTRDESNGTLTLSAAEMQPRPEVFGDRVPLVTGKRRSVFTGSWSRHNSVVIVHDSPLPFTIRAMALEYEIGSR